MGSPNQSRKAPVIDEEKCTQCGLCVKVCLIYENVNGKAVVARPDFCIQCGHCGSFCPAQAITETPAEPERLEKDWKDGLPSPESLQLLFRSRRSVRKYKPGILKQQDLDKILEAGRYTPTGSNEQGIKYIIINDHDKMGELREMALPVMKKLFNMALRIAKSPMGPGLLGENQAYNLKTHYAPAVNLLFDRNALGEDRLFNNAPALMLVHGEKRDEAMAFSCHIAMFNCSLMAHTLGIGCLLNSFALMAINGNKKIRNWIGVPKTDKCFGAMSMGYQGVKYNALVKRNPVNVRYL